MHEKVKEIGGDKLDELLGGTDRPGEPDEVVVRREDDGPRDKTALFTPGKWDRVLRYVLLGLCDVLDDAGFVFRSEASVESAKAKLEKMLVEDFLWVDGDEYRNVEMKEDV